MSVQKTDIAIIGAGPVGLFAVFQCGMLGMKSHVIDALPEIGGQCTALYPEKPIYDIPAHPSILGGSLIDQLAAQAAPFDPVYHLNQQVVSLLKDDHEDFHLVTSTGNEIQAKAVFIAAGPGAFGPNKPPLENIEQFENTSIHYLVREKSCFAGKTLVIAGGGDSAVDWAVSLSEVAEKIYIVHRRDKFRAAPDSVLKLNALCAEGRIEKCTSYQLRSVTGEGQNINTVNISDLDGNQRAIKADHLLCFYGLKQDLGPINRWGLDIDRFYISVNQSTSETNIQGVYAVGDVAHYINKIKLITTGFAEVAQAAHHAYGRVFPEQSLHFEYSTTKGVPQINDDKIKTVKDR